MPCEPEQDVSCIVSLTIESKIISIKKKHLLLKNDNDKKFPLTRSVEFPRNSTETLRHKTLTMYSLINEDL